MKTALLILGVVVGGGIAWWQYREISATERAIDQAMISVNSAAAARKPASKLGVLDPMEGIKPDLADTGRPWETYTSGSAELHTLIEDLVAQFSQKTLNQKMATIYEDAKNNIVLLELLGERGYKNDLYVIHTKTNKVLRTKSNKDWSNKVVGFLDEYIIFEEGCLEGCTVPVNVRILNRNADKRVTLGSAADINIYLAAKRVGYKPYAKVQQTYDSPEQCPQTNCCDDEGKNCKATVTKHTEQQFVTSLP